MDILNIKKEKRKQQAKSKAKQIQHMYNWYLAEKPQTPGRKYSILYSRKLSEIN